MSISSFYNNNELFFIAKTHALLHDPPHKSFVLFEHENVAKGIRSSILSNIPILSSGLPREWVDVINRADVYASSFDRWVLDMLYHESYLMDYVVGFNRLLNIFDPSYASNEIIFEGSENLEKRISEAATELNNILRRVSEKTRDLRLLYETLYIAYELVWLSKSLPISPADTRTPTHTTFDHLYATASAINISLYEEPSGYLVMIDIPGVQRFVSSARKVGDFWAGSWLLSKTMWYLVENLIKRYGPDILVSPSPRLNPYLLTSLIRELENVGVDREIINKLLNLYREVLEKLGIEIPEKIREPGDLREFLELIPLIPATHLIIIPKIDIASKKDLEKKIREMYIGAWRRVINNVENRLRDLVEGKKEFTDIDLASLRILERLKDLVEEPYTDIRIDVIDISEVYSTTKKCLIEKERCSEIGLDIGRVENIRSILREDNKKLDDLAKKISWFIAISKGINRSRLENNPPQPRHFWYYEEKLNKISPLFKSLTQEDADNWRICSLDGEEPAIIHIKKRVTREGLEEYDEEDLKRLLEKLDFREEDINKIIDDMRILIRPGEALGPYCLLKRIIYMTYRDTLSRILSFSSTDDVALDKLQETISDFLEGDARNKVIDMILNEMRHRDLLKDESVAEDLREIIDNALEAIFPKGCIEKKGVCGTKMRDIYKAPIYVNEAIKKYVPEKFSRLLTPEEFIDIVCISLQEIFEREGTDVSKYVEKLFKEYSRYIDVLQIINRSDKRDLAKLMCIRTSYAIAKADGDYIGDLATGYLKSFGLDLEKYVERLLDSLRKYSVIYRNKSMIYDEEKEEFFKKLENSYREMINIVETILGSSDRLVISPAYTYTLSTFLMINSLRDVTLILRYRGFPVFSGGDDLLALLPIDTVLPLVFEGREYFNGEGMFLYIRFGDKSIPVISAPPTGRSYSVRYTQLMDIMSLEIRKTIDLLEDEAKKSSWRGMANGKKDTLVISDSRSNYISLIPLRLSIGDGCIGPRFFAKMVSMLAVSIFTRYLSPSFPEDLESELMSIVSRDLDPEILEILGGPSLEKIFIKILAKNIKEHSEKEKKQAIGIITKYLEDEKCKNVIYNIYRESGDTKIPALIYISNLVKILRGYP